MTPPPKLTLSEWADENRVLSAESSAERGRWRTSRAEFQRGIMDAITDPKAHTVVVRKPAQVGWTEIINNVVGYFVDRDPASILIMQPTVKMAETWSKKRLTPMLRDTPCLRGKIKDAKSRDSDNTILEKGFPGGYMAIVGANTPNDLASRPIRVVLADEVDKYPASAGDFGDPLALASSRQATFWNRKTLVGSTPGDMRLSTVERKFQEGDQRHYHVPCPHCGHRQVLRWEQVVWDKDETGHKPETAHYACEAPDCGTLWSDAERWRAIAKGEWIATKPFKGTASFAVSGFMSPWLTLEGIVSKFLAAKDFPHALRQWVNEVKGEAWEERGEAADADALASRLEAYDGDTLPDWVRLVTAGADTQDDRLEVTYTAWGDGEEAWVIRHDVLPGNTAELAVWDDLDRALRDSVFTIEGGRKLKVRAACIDSGGHRGAMVLSFARARASRKIYATKGVGNDHRGSKPIWGKALLKTKNAGDRLWAVGVDTGKDDLAARLRIVPGEGPTPKAVHFPATGLSADYFEQLTAEQAVMQVNQDGRKVRRWKLKQGQERNEALDCFILSHAAMLSLPVRLVKAPRRTGVPVEDATAEHEEVAVEAAEEQATPVAQPKLRRRRAKWKGYS
ncbi:Phage terminase, large subunit [Limimaricola hongkongensis DSM 17492]|uniref:Phage terminase, large subunit n=2 Tax=Limimaricola hongkongensis TaxID=278132 RepID=A0A017HDC4_9RHOB|nr:Phage terminase, large subunit [Limimaricola hongkongensis DSM 17492]